MNTTPLVLVIFGMSGDLSKRLLFPAICNLGGSGLLDPNFRIIGLGTTPASTIEFREILQKNIEHFVTAPAAQAFGSTLLDKIDYLPGDLEDIKIYDQLQQHLQNLYAHHNMPPNALFYLAVPPIFFGPITAHLGALGLLEEKNGHCFRRIVIEKPFGQDLVSAQALNATLLSVAKEEQLFRIDHFLGKETVQNLMALRFANGVFEPIWNRNYIDSIQITLAETLGVELRGKYYDTTGALRDMVPNHLFQVLSLVAMESPVSFAAKDIHTEKEKIFNAIQPFTPEDVFTCAVRGQYTEGSIHQQAVVAYRDEARVASNSITETFVALKLKINNWRWLGVPFYLRTGKRMPRRTSEIVIRFKHPPSVLFKDIADCPGSDNLLRIQLQPDEGMSFRFAAKIPGPIMRLGEVDMRFAYKDYFGASCSTGYETLLYDCINGDHTLFTRAAMVETSWQIIQPVLDAWSTASPDSIPQYAAGSWGPKAAEDLLAADGRRWIFEP